MTNYRNLTKAQAATALQEFLDERGPALTRLREALVADGQDPAALLDGTVDSLVPLWRWTLSRLTWPDAPGATDPATVPREMWPSWERYTTEEEWVLSLESLTLLDGLVSYLVSVVGDRAPAARWDIARDRNKRYVYNNHPVLVSGTGENHNFLPEIPVVAARADLRGIRKSTDDKIAAYAQAVIDELNQGDSNAGEETVEPEPLVEIDDIRDEPGDYDFEIGLSDELAHPRSAEIDRLIRKLSSEDGVKDVLREDRDLILVRAPSWSADALRTWITRHI